VRDGAGTILTLATFNQGAYRVSSSNGFEVVHCDFTYTATVSQQPVYTFVLTGGTASTSATRDTETVSVDQLRQKGAPSLYVQESFCPEC
jgi:hypothetical protein